MKLKKLCTSIINSYIFIYLLLISFAALIIIKALHYKHFTFFLIFRQFLWSIWLCWAHCWRNWLRTYIIYLQYSRHYTTHLELIAHFVKSPFYSNFWNRIPIFKWKVHFLSRFLSKMRPKKSFWFFIFSFFSIFWR